MPFNTCNSLCYYNLSLDVCMRSTSTMIVEIAGWVCVARIYVDIKCTPKKMCS